MSQYSSSVFSFSGASRATCFLLGLHLVKQGIQALEAALPKPAIVLQPSNGFGERLCLEPPRPPLRIAAPRNQACPFQHLQMLRNRGLSHRERLGQLHNRRFPGRKERQDRPPRWVGKRGECCIEVAGTVHCYSSISPF